MIHEIKCWPEFFGAFLLPLDRRKAFEVRVDDRPYAAGDMLHQREWNPVTGEYTGREIVQFVTYVLRDRPPWTPLGYVVMSVCDLAPHSEIGAATDDLFATTEDVNGKPISRWQERLEQLYTANVPFGEILSLVRTLMDECVIDHILSMPENEILVSFDGDPEQFAAEMRQKFGTIARLAKERDAALARERVAVEAYERQQGAQRELEALYQQMTERALRLREGIQQLAALLLADAPHEYDMDAIDEARDVLVALIPAWLEARDG